MQNIQERLDAYKKLNDEGTDDEKRRLLIVEPGCAHDAARMRENGELISIGVYRNFTRFEEYQHSYIEALLVVHGSIINNIDGKRVSMDEGELLLINRFSSQGLICQSGNTLVLSIAILPEYVDEVYRLAGNDDITAAFTADLLVGENKKGEYICFKPSDVTQISKLLDNMLFSRLEGDADKNWLLETTMGLIFFYILDNLQHAAMRSPSRYENMVAMTALDYIEHNYCDGTLTDLSRRLHMPTHTLSRMIKKTTGFNFKELLLQKRLIKSVMLLCDTDTPISEIVQAVGYENNSYYHRVFREKYNMTPRIFRGRYSKNKQIRL